MTGNDNILGVYVSGASVYFEDDQRTKDLAREQTDLFTSYIWGEKGIANTLKKLKHRDYGKDIVLILFQFYVSPIPYLKENLKEIENYRKTEKSIGIPIIVTNENFFAMPEEERYHFFKTSILQRLDLLGELVKKKKLDTDIKLLKVNLSDIIK